MVFFTSVHTCFIWVPAPTHLIQGLLTPGNDSFIWTWACWSRDASKTCRVRLNKTGMQGVNAVGSHMIAFCFCLCFSQLSRFWGTLGCTTCHCIQNFKIQFFMIRRSVPLASVVTSIVMATKWPEFSSVYATKTSCLCLGNDMHDVTRNRQVFCFSVP